MRPTLAPFRRRRSGAVVVVLMLILLLATQSRRESARTHQAPGTPPPLAATPSGGLSAVSVRSAFDARRSDVWLETSGSVQRLLEDDTDTRDGSDKHQRFLLRTDDGVTVLVAHNLAAAARVPAKVGDRVAVRGEYEWSDKGGTIHFTHAPKYQTRNADRRGWIEHAGTKYE